MDKLEEIKKKYKSPNENIGWLITEIERLREVIVNELNRLKYFVDSDSVKAQQVLLKALKEGK